MQNILKPRSDCASCFFPSSESGGVTWAKLIISQLYFTSALEHESENPLRTSGAVNKNPPDVDSVDLIRPIKLECRGFYESGQIYKKGLLSSANKSVIHLTG